MVAMAHDDTVFLGNLVLGIQARSRRAVNGLPLEIGDCELALAIEGGALKVARAYQLAGGIPTLMGLIVGVDVPGAFLESFGVREVLAPRHGTSPPLAHPPRIIPDGRRSGASATTFLRQIQTVELTHIESPLSNPYRLVLAAMTAEQAPLVRRLVEGRSHKVCLLLTPSQCRDRDTTFELARQCDLVQLNADELAEWTGIRNDVASGINGLRDRGVNQVIVIDGQRGITAFVAGEWHHQAAFRMERRQSDGQCCDIIFGTYLAARHQGRSIRNSLKLAAAAAAMKLAGVARHQRGLNEVVVFSETTPTQRYSLEAN